MHLTVDAKSSSSRAAVWSLVLLAPAALFLMAVFLNEALGIGFLLAPVEALMSEPSRRQVFKVVSPLVFLGGIAAALLLNALAIAQLDLRWERNRLVSTVTIEPRTPNLVLILSGGLMLAMNRIAI